MNASSKESNCLSERACVNAVTLSVHAIKHERVSVCVCDLCCPRTTGNELAGLSRGGQQIQKSREQWAKAVSILVSLASLQVNPVVCSGVDQDAGCDERGCKAHPRQSVMMIDNQPSSNPQCTRSHVCSTVS